MSPNNKLSVSLSSSKRYYSTGSLVSGIVYATLDAHYAISVEELRISLICKVDSTAWNQINDSQVPVHETTTLMRKDHVLWSRISADQPLPKSLSFKIVIPDVGFDSSINLPPSFSAKWFWREGDIRSIAFKNSTEIDDIACVRYYIKASALGSDLAEFYKSKVPLVFVPRNMGRLNLPLLPANPSYEELKRSGSFRRVGTITSTIQRKLFFGCGTSTLSIWVPNLPKLPQRKPIPVFVCLTLTGLPDTPGHKNKTSLLLSVAPQFRGVELFLQHRVRITAESNNHNIKITDKKNILSQVQPYTNDWTQVKTTASKTTWQKSYIWKVLWINNAVPNFTISQISLAHHLVAKVPISGIGNSVALVSDSLNIGVYECDC